MLPFHSLGLFGTPELDVLAKWPILQNCKSPKTQQQHNSELSKHLHKEQLVSKVIGVCKKLLGIKAHQK